MKKLLFILFAILLVGSAQAQKIHFTDTSNVWKELIVTVTGSPPEFWYYTYHYIGDSTIDSNNYKWFSFEGNYCQGCGSFVREDTILNKVYIRDIPHDSDIVLMDYNLNVADTFVTFYNQWSHTYYRYVVAAMDSTLINAVWHRVWHFDRELDPGSFSAWCSVIEGIGCIQHPTYMLQDIGIIGEYYDYMYCFSNNSTTPPLSPAVSFFDNDTSCADFPYVKVNSLAPSVNQVVVFPNPVETQLTISASVKVISLMISDRIGRVWYRSGPDAENVPLNVSFLPKGVYFATINGQTVRKFVKQ